MVVYWISSKCMENFFSFCFICIESAVIAQSIRRETFPMHQKSTKTMKLFCYLVLVFYSILSQQDTRLYCLVGNISDVKLWQIHLCFAKALPSKILCLAESCEKRSHVIFNPCENGWHFIILQTCILAVFIDHRRCLIQTICWVKWFQSLFANCWFYQFVQVFHRLRFPLYSNQIKYFGIIVFIELATYMHVNIVGMGSN